MVGCGGGSRASLSSIQAGADAVVQEHRVHCSSSTTPSSSSANTVIKLPRGMTHQWRQCDRPHSKTYENHQPENDYVQRPAMAWSILIRSDNLRSTRTS